MSVEANESREPRVLGEFVIREKLGEGGFGTVYRAEQKSLLRPAVIKVMRPALAQRADAIERFMREARVASRFDHPYAAHVYAFGAEPDGEMWIAMELVRGTSLDEMIGNAGSVPVERFIPLLERLCEAVQSGHEQGVVHRDIKPSNVMVISRAGKLFPKLLDFGIAKLLTDDVQVTVKQPPALPSTSVGFEHTLDLAGGSSPGTLASSLTREGQVLGSPHYMAPEQWLDASIVGPWTDQYALAMLAYEALSGNRAFQSTTLSELARQHVQDQLPSLPTKLPAELNRVLARAAAKDPQDRYPSVGEFAAALRAAAGLAGEVIAPPPMLSGELAAQWIADAPQPIAESIAALVNAKSTSRVIDRVGVAVSVLVRWLGVLSLACRSRSGKLTTAEGEALDLVRASRRRLLRDEEWLALSRALIRSSLDRRGAWPIPEMTELVADVAPMRALDALVRGDGALPAVGEHETAGGQHASQLIARFECVLEGLSWLCHYEVARGTKHGFELWMGQRGEDRLQRRGSGEDEGRVVILDGDGARIVALSPLVHIEAPVPGDAPDVFVFAGPGRAGDHALTSALPRGFEREHDAIWPWFANTLIDDAGDSVTTGVDEERSPYPGLSPFTTSDRDSFFGREQDVEELVNRLRAQSLVALVGPSGVGKSSFIAAGLVPALPSGWRAEVVRPGADPLAALRAAIERIDLAPYRDAPRVTEDAQALTARLVRAAEELATTVVIVVDQGEELFTMCKDVDARAAFASVLADAAGQKIRVVVSMRDDFLCRADELGAWRGRLGRSVQILKTPDRPTLERILVTPARRRGHDFDDAKLPAEIVAEIADRPGALPLLAFTAARLWDDRDRHFKRITRASYERIGGVSGALAKHADHVIDKLTVAERKLARLAFRRLLTSDGTRAFVGRAELVEALGGTAAATIVVDRLIAARLVTSLDAESGDRIELVHESLLVAWPRLAEWRRDDLEVSKLQERIAAAARHWEDRGRPAGLLWRDAALRDLVRWRSQHDQLATPIERAFSDASELATRRSRRRRFAIVASAFGILTSGVIGLAWANGRISTQKHDAVKRLATTLEDRGRVAVLDGDATHALLYLAEAKRLGAKGTALDLLIAQASAPVSAMDAHVAQQPPVDDVLFDANRIVTLAWADNTARVYAADSGAQLRVGPAAGETMAVTTARQRLFTISRAGVMTASELSTGAVAWSKPLIDSTDGWIRLAAGDAAGMIGVFYPGTSLKLWSLDDGAPRGELAIGKEITAVSFDSTGKRVATGDIEGHVKIWDLATREAVACPDQQTPVHSVVFARGGAALAAASFDRTIVICDVATGQVTARLEGHTNAPRTLIASPDGLRLASTSEDGTARIWDVDGNSVAVLRGHQGTVRTATFSADGARLATGGADGSVRIWDAATGVPVTSLQGHVAMVRGVFFAPDGRAITAGQDGTLRWWHPDLSLAAPIAQQHDAIVDLAATNTLSIAASPSLAVVSDVQTFTSGAHLGGGQQVRISADQNSAVTAGRDGARLWSVPDGKLIAQLSQTDVSNVVVANSGVIATATRDASVQLWSSRGEARGAIQLSTAAKDEWFVRALAFDPSGSRLYAEDGKQLAVIDVASSRIVDKLAYNGTNPRAIAIDDTRVALSSDSMVEIFMLSTRAHISLVHPGGFANSMRFLPDGRLLTAGEYTVALWDRDAKLVGSLPVDGSRIQAVDIAADGSLLAFAHADGSARVWDASRLAMIARFYGHRGAATRVKFTPDGTRLLSAGRDGTVVEWKLERATQSLAQVADLVRCRVPYQLVGDVALPRELPIDDPSCR